MPTIPAAAQPSKTARSSAKAILRAASLTDDQSESTAPPLDIIDRLAAEIEPHAHFDQCIHRAPHGLYHAERMSPLLAHYGPYR
jgi:hypothetical protein